MRALERSRNAVKGRRELRLKPTRSSAPNSGSKVSLLVSIISVALPIWLAVSSDTRRRKSCTISIGQAMVIGLTSAVQNR